MEYIHAVTKFIMAESQPFTIVGSPKFHNLFRPFHKEADKITDVPPNQVREEIFSLGVLAKATKLDWGGKRDRGRPTIGRVTSAITLLLAMLEK
jgi:hypothetical protein